MDSLLDWEHYHRLNVILLSVVGLWPHGNKIVLRLKCFVGSMFAAGCCVCQLASFFTVHYTTELILNNAPPIFVGCGILIKYISVFAAGNSIKRVTETINADWRDLSTNEEIRIIKKHIERGNFHTKGFSLLIFQAAICLMVAPFISLFLDLMMPLSESRNRTFPVMFELFIDQKKYFFFVAFVFDSAIVVGALIFVSTEGLLIVYVQHACALIEVTSHRIKKLLCVTGSSNSTRSCNLVIIAQVVEIHCRAIRHCKRIKEDLLPSYLILTLFGVLSLSTYLFRCTQKLVTHEFSEFLTSGVFCIAILGYAFYFAFIMQNVLASSGNLFDVLYDTEWYKFPASTRKLVLFCMLNSIKPIVLDIFSVYIPSYHGFSLIARMVMSYTTALWSFQ